SNERRVFLRRRLEHSTTATWKSSRRPRNHASRSWNLVDGDRCKQVRGESRWPLSQHTKRLRGGSCRVPSLGLSKSIPYGANACAAHSSRDRKQGESGPRFGSDLLDSPSTHWMANGGFRSFQCNRRRYDRIRRRDRPAVVHKR